MNDYRSGTLAGAGARSVDEGLRKYMLGVFNYMALGVALSGVFSLVISGNDDLMRTFGGTPLRWVPFVGILGVGFVAPRVIQSGSRVAAHGMFWLYAGLWGLLIAPVLFIFRETGSANLIYQAFFITSAVFAGMSFLGYTTKRDLMGMGGFLAMATIGLLVAIIANALFFKSGMMGFIVSILVVLVFSAVTAWETQLIKRLYHEGGDNERASILGAFMLYGSFATLFINILNILGFMRD